MKRKRSESFDRDISGDAFSSSSSSSSGTLVPRVIKNITETKLKLAYTRDIKQDLDTIMRTKQWWEIKPAPIFHHLISVIIAQRVRFTVGLNIRKRFYSLANSKGNAFITPEFIEDLSDAEMKSTKLGNKQSIVVKELARIHKQQMIRDPDTSLKDLICCYKNVSGVGVWTVKALQIIFGLDKNIIFYEDKWVRDRAKQVFGCSSSPKASSSSSSSFLNSKRSFNNFFTSQWKGYETLISYFLWRLTPCGAEKFKTSNNQCSQSSSQNGREQQNQLTQEDFL